MAGGVQLTIYTVLRSVTHMWGQGWRYMYASTLIVHCTALHCHIGSAYAGKPNILFCSRSFNMVMRKIVHAQRFSRYLLIKREIRMLYIILTILYICKTIFNTSGPSLSNSGQDPIWKVRFFTDVFWNFLYFSLQIKLGLVVNCLSLYAPVHGDKLDLLSLAISSCLAKSAKD